MAAGLGIDLLEIERLERALERYPRLADRLFSADELTYARRRARPGRHLAARFAAKEAVAKALAGGFRPSEIEIVGGQPPSVRLRGRCAAVAHKRSLEVSVSLTHSRHTAAAVALVQERAPG